MKGGELTKTMPNIKSAKKQMKQAVKKEAMNNIYEKKVRDIMNKAEKKAKGANKAKMISEAYKQIDKAATKDVIHPNRAARLKSRVTRLLAK